MKGGCPCGLTIMTSRFPFSFFMKTFCQKMWLCQITIFSARGGDWNGIFFCIRLTWKCNKITSFWGFKNWKTLVCLSFFEGVGGGGGGSGIAFPLAFIYWVWAFLLFPLTLSASPPLRQSRQSRMKTRKLNKCFSDLGFWKQTSEGLF